MINLNGTIQNIEYSQAFENRAFCYGDCAFDVLKCVNKKLYFWEEHYLRLMSNMRILRMKIPVSFTMEFLEEEIMKTLQAKELLFAYSKVKIYVFREDSQEYAPDGNNANFAISVSQLPYAFYKNEKKDYQVDIYRDFYIQVDLLSTIKSTNRNINVISSVYAKENGYENCILLNNEKNVVGFSNGNIFLVNGNQVVTPPTKDGCINGITRKKVIEIIRNTPEYSVVEKSVTPFELQKADEMFLTNSIMGIQSVSKYKKKQYTTQVADNLLARLNTFARASQN